MTAHNKFKSLDVDLLTQLCKELRNRYGDEVAYDGALLLAATVVSCSWLASHRTAIQLSALWCCQELHMGNVWWTATQRSSSQHSKRGSLPRRSASGHCFLTMNRFPRLLCCTTNCTSFLRVFSRIGCVESLRCSCQMAPQHRECFVSCM